MTKIKEYNKKLNNLCGLLPKYYYEDWEYEDRIYSIERTWFNSLEEAQNSYKVQISGLEVIEAYVDFLNPYNFLKLLNMCVKNYINVVVGVDITSKNNKVGCWYAETESYADTFQEAFIIWLVDCLEGTKEEIEDHVFLNNLFKKDKFIDKMKKEKWNWND